MVCRQLVYGLVGHMVLPALISAFKTISIKVKKLCRKYLGYCPRLFKSLASCFRWPVTFQGGKAFPVAGTLVKSSQRKSVAWLWYKCIAAFMVKNELHWCVGRSMIIKFKFFVTYCVEVLFWKYNIPILNFGFSSHFTLYICSCYL